MTPLTGAAPSCPLPQPHTCGIACVRAAMTPARRPTTTDTHGRALARARADRTNRTEQK